ncbi:hypothetical protein HPB48_014669 [Haemaphysalis longicornis]|uniref:RNase H type-1 domain-containing protein n=1 Tax=Haemaphysalis longicornis TaxID=44386 RepID=A0A9J6GGV3_HAELO|nr:hypothetical protein HPB48_014669 [Haemaphysalis longicornis]
MPHLSYLKTKIEVVVPKITAFINMHYKLPPDSLRRLYVQLVEPVVTFASPTWWSPSPTIYLQSRLKSIQRLPLLALTGAVQSVRTEALNALTGIPPICETLSACRLHFLAFHLRKDVSYGHYNVTAADVQAPFNPCRFHPADRVICPFDRLTLAEAMHLARWPGLHVYTDGAFSSLSAGAAFVVYTHTGRLVEAKRFKLSSAGSAFAAELVALREALIYLFGYHTVQPAHLHTDCLSLLIALASLRTRSNIIEDIRSIYAARSNRLPVFLYHIRGHAGVPGNEVADHLAVRACTVTCYYQPAKVLNKKEGKTRPSSDLELPLAPAGKAIIDKPDNASIK